MLETGVPNLDLILGGGIPEGDMLLVYGQAGAGKTTLAIQIAFHTASLGQNALYISTLSEPPPRLMRHIRSLSFFDEHQIGKHLFVSNIYPLIRKGLAEVVSALISAVKENQARLLIIDGLMAIRDIHPQPLEMRTFIYELGDILSTMDTTAILTTGALEFSDGYPVSEFTMADGLIELGKKDMGTRTVRTLRASKIRGVEGILEPHTFNIDRNGITVFPRLESIFEAKDIETGTARVPLGLSELDKMMQGGPRVGSATILAGEPGTGKTLALLGYVLEGARRGERGAFVSFRETPRQLIEKARAFGMDLETPIKDGRVTVFHRSLARLIIDEVTWAMWSELECCSPQRLALDGVNELKRLALRDDRWPGYAASLLGLLKEKGVTSLMAEDIPRQTESGMDDSDMILETLADNVVVLRHVDHDAQASGILSIQKMRDSAYDHFPRKYVIAEKGFAFLTEEETDGTSSPRIPRSGVPNTGK